MKSVKNYAPLISIGVLGCVLFVIAATIVLALIPIYLKSDTTPIYGSMPFSMNYAIGNGALPSGSVANNHLLRLHDQLSSIAIDTVNISLTSANVVDQSGKKRSLFRRQTVGSQVLQLNGIVHARQGCLRQCLVDFVKQFKSALCTMQLSLIQ